MDNLSEILKNMSAKEFADYLNNLTNKMQNRLERAEIERELNEPTIEEVLKRVKEFTYQSSKGTNVYVLVSGVLYEGESLKGVYDSLLKAQSQFNDVRIEDWKESEDEDGKYWSINASKLDTGCDYYAIYRMEVK